MEYKLRLTGKQHASLFAHLFPGDGLENVAFAFCGRHVSGAVTILTVCRILLLQSVKRTEFSVLYSTDDLVHRLDLLETQELSILKIHSHPNGFQNFSAMDDRSDHELFPSLYSRNEEVPIHASAIMLPDGTIFCRSIHADGAHTPFTSVSIAGSEIKFMRKSTGKVISDAFMERNEQAFGSKTTSMLADLHIGVVGCSGTGSIVIEQLARLGVGNFTLVDPKVVGEKNLNRILNSSLADAEAKTPKVSVMRKAILAFNPNADIQVVASSAFHPDVIASLAKCDVLFGCVDTVDGRHLLNLIATHYLVPFFDVGIRLDADGNGGISHITGSVHYIQPDGSSLMSREVYTPEQLSAASMVRTDPAQYRQLRKEKYVIGVDEERPAVISVNMFYASLAINDFLARLHPYRDSENVDFARTTFSLSQMRFITEADGESCPFFKRYVGLGDQKIPLGLVELNENPSKTT